MNTEQLHEEYTIDTPENVTIGYAVAGIGSRFIAALIDSVLIGLLLLVLNIALILILAALDPSSTAISFDENESWIGGLVIALYALLNFAVFWGYFLLFEWLWQGQTPGKRNVRLRVVRTDGSPAGFLPIAVRNLVRVVDFLPVGYGVGVVTMFCNRQARRLGDFAAGTLVVKEQDAVTLDTLLRPATPAPRPAVPASVIPAAPPVEEAPALNDPQADWSGIRRLTSADYELVQESLARYGRGQLDRQLLGRVARVIATKIGRPPSSPIDAPAFLADVAAAYGRWVR